MRKNNLKIIKIDKNRKLFKTLFKLCLVIFNFFKSSEIVIPLYIDNK